MNKIELLKTYINESDNIVFFGGAGVSTESGIPDFRSENGLYNQKYDYPPEKILSHHFFINNTDAFFKFYFDKMVINGINPNDCHKKLSELEKMGKLKAIVTQNIDTLHEDAGSKNVLKLHGTIKDNHCMRCQKYYSLNDLTKKGYTCECGGIIKPDVVLYEEPLDERILQKAIFAISHADLLIVGGTSLNVYPAAGLLRYFNGKHLVLINKSTTPYDKMADLIINEPIAEVFKQI
jgi:NAD-dependent deacetylase